MLPFLKPKNIASTIIASYSKGQIKPEHEEGRSAPELVKHAEALISATMAKDAEAVAAAMSSMNTHFNSSKDDNE